MRGRPRERKVLEEVPRLKLRLGRHAPWPEGAEELTESVIGGVPVGLSWTPGPLGGHRPWLLCPACGRRCVVLLKLPGGPRCIRCCPSHAYRTQFVLASDRSFAKRNKILHRLGAPAPASNLGWWNRPKGMRHTTFCKLVKKAKAAENDAILAAGVELGIIDANGKRRQPPWLVQGWR